MIDCSRFEELFHQWRHGKLGEREIEELRQHQESCPFCRRYDELTDNVRFFLKEQLPVAYPSFRINRALYRSPLYSFERVGNRAETKSSGSWRVLGFGLATGLAVGALLVFFKREVPESRTLNPAPTAPSITQKTPQEPANIALKEKEADSLPSSQKTYPLVPPYSLDPHSQMVSSPSGK